MADNRYLAGDIVVVVGGRGEGGGRVTTGIWRELWWLRWGEGRRGGWGPGERFLAGIR